MTFRPDNDDMKNSEHLKNRLKSFLRLPWIDGNIPGSIVEQVVALTYNADVLDTYDYVDVVIRGETGWQVKSTMESTPLTWKRAKISNKLRLIEESLGSDDGRQNLGNAIIDFCNSHAIQSFKNFKIKEIRYARCIVLTDGQVRFFDRKLADKRQPNIFNKEDYFWKWSTPKKTTKKEQLPALHGFDAKSGIKVWAWHGNGENQLHFSGEKMWWDDGKNDIDFTIDTPPPKMSWEEFFDAIHDFKN